ncbi:hypothetical protein ES705_29306 [subsurface metagenome]
MRALVSDYFYQVLVIFTKITPVLKMRIIERELSKSILLLFLPAVIWLFVNATVNRHNHSLSEDYAISHAHPYDKSPSGADSEGSHHHNEAELFLISLISDPAATTIIIFLLLLFLIADYQLLKIHSHLPVTVKELYQVRNYHAPPGF